jgi:hypothetical protein
MSYEHDIALAKRSEMVYDRLKIDASGTNPMNVNS